MKSTIRLIKSIRKKNEIKAKSKRPKNVRADTRGNKKTSSISYSRKKEKYEIEQDFSKGFATFFVKWI